MKHKGKAGRMGGTRKHFIFQEYGKKGATPSVLGRGKDEG